MSAPRRFGPLIGSVDEGTSKARFFIFAAETAEMITYHQVDVKSIHPREGWVEQNPMEILHAVKKCMEVTIDNLTQLDIDPSDILAIGISNQRETVVLWDKFTGEPLYNAIVWSDVRNKDTVQQFIAKSKRKCADYLKPICGLPISTYFSALKIRWLIDNIPEVNKAVIEERCLFGTVDSWLIWNLTGGVNNGIHITDVTNASRTMLMNIDSLKWDPLLLRFFDIPSEILPKIRSSSEIYGYIVEGLLHGVPISGCLGDQQAALVGQMCLKKGQMKNTYGTGSFLLYNTGKAKIWSDNGLLTTVAYQFGPKSPPIYALEGSIAIAGAALFWLKDNLNIFEDFSQISDLSKAKTTNNIYFVPAFCGLYAPYWRTDACSAMFGMNENTQKTDIIRATIEAICFQTRDILEALAKDCGERCVKKLLIDGGMACNDYVVQLLADIIGIPVVRPTMTETTALGAAIAAGCAEGIKIWDLNKVQPTPSDTFHPLISINERDTRYYKWKMAVSKSLDWEIRSEIKTKNCTDLNEKKILRMMPATVFLMSSFGLMLLAEYFQ
ncbi:glycerol kinase 3-like [Planococcus citri]|uniref:glycerol kinase 3-like n=1 Tax=Planococcus citri TaxID=170843 RepID=UPI0031F84F4E